LKLPAPGLHGTFAKAYTLLTKINAKIGWDNLLKARSSVFVMEEEYRIEKGKPVESPPATNGVPTVNAESDKKSVSSLDPSPPTPTSPHLPGNEIGLPPNLAEENVDGNRTMFQSKRLCERWLDNLFMVLYEVYLILSSAHAVGSESIHTLACGIGTFHQTAASIS